jgi:hypothetical protein
LSEARLPLQWRETRASVPNHTGDMMAQNHYTTKTKRRQKNKKRKDPSASTMAKIRQLEAAAKAK